MSLSASLLMGVVGVVIMFVGARQIVAGTLTIGGFFTYTLFLGFLVAPMIQIVSIGTQLTEALAGLERTHEILSERREDGDPRRTVEPDDIQGKIEFQDVSFSYDGNRTVLSEISFQAEPGTVTALVGSPDRAGGRVRREFCGEIRHRGRRARGQALRRTAAAHFDRARASGRAAHLDTG